MISGQPRSLDLQCSSLLISAINCILQNFQFIKRYVPLLLSTLTSIHIYQKNQAMLITGQFHKTEYDKYSIVFKKPAQWLSGRASAL